MRKHKILIVALALAVMCTGAGYAYWTQSLTINNTVSTGNLDVAFIDPTEVDWETNNYLWDCHSNHVTVGAIIAGNGQSLDFTVENFYPGAGASLNFVVQNTGSVAAKITDITGTITKNTELCNAFDFKFDKVEVLKANVFGFLVPYREDIIKVEADNVPDLAVGLTNALKDIILEPGDTLVLKSDGWFNTGIGGEEENPGYEIIMDKDITGHQYEKETAKFKLDLAFTQVN